MYVEDACTTVAEEESAIDSMKVNFNLFEVTNFMLSHLNLFLFSELINKKLCLLGLLECVCTMVQAQI